MLYWNIIELPASIFAIIRLIVTSVVLKLSTTSTDKPFFARLIVTSVVLKFYMPPLIPVIGIRLIVTSVVLKFITSTAACFIIWLIVTSVVLK